MSGGNSAFLLRFLGLLWILWSASSASGAELRGTATNAQGGEPIRKVEVSVVDAGISVATDSGGAFSISQIAAGAHTLRLSAVGYRTTTIPFTLQSATEVKEFSIAMIPDNFRRTEVVEVHGDVFETSTWPAVGDMNLTSNELQQTATVLADDPYRSLQTLPGVSATANNDFYAQFSVMDAPYNQIGVYLDDVLVPSLLHTVNNIPDALTLSFLTGSSVEDLRLFPAVLPERYGADIGAALAVTSRTGSDGPPLFHVSLGMADSEFLGEGSLGSSHKGTWLFGARKSYLGYLNRNIVHGDFSQVGFYDTNLKLTYDLTPANSISLFALGGQTNINYPSLPPSTEPNVLKSGGNDLAVARLGWRYQRASHLVLDTRAFSWKDLLLSRQCGEPTYPNCQRPGMERRNDFVLELARGLSASDGLVPPAHTICRRRKFVFDPTSPLLQRPFSPARTRLVWPGISGFLERPASSGGRPPLGEE